MKNLFLEKGSLLTGILMAALISGCGGSNVKSDIDNPNPPTEVGKWVCGDFHNHTYLSDGSRTQAKVAEMAFQYGLDWFANCDHGGTSTQDPDGNKLATPIWRWLTLKDQSFPLIQDLRTKYPQKLIIQGFEWNVPTHEHASVGIVGTEPVPISDFEYLFDGGDKDTSRDDEGLKKNNSTHEGALAAINWLQTNHPQSSYVIPNHPSRKLKYSVADLRGFNDAAPAICFGFEGMPGHQKESSRGGYSGTDLKAQTYGGADYMIAKVGGLWDALLGEGRRFWTFANSDFHEDKNDFWPGEYTRTYTWVTGNTYQAIVDGLRSGNSFSVHGNLINALDFKLTQAGNAATMGQELNVASGSDLMITIRFKTAEISKVDHIDLIAGEVKEKALPGSAEYQNDTNPTTKVLKRFTAADWKLENGYYVINYELKNLQKKMYFRLRGTNLDLNVANETDAEGNPLSDASMGQNNAEKALQDLWFYSIPIFVGLK